jgi:hypothetical protein
MPDWLDGLDDRTCEADPWTRMMDRPAIRSRAAQPGAAPRRYYIYVVELDDAVGPRRDPRYPSLYVGQSVVPPRSAFVSTRMASDPLGRCGSTAGTFARGCIGASTRWQRATKPSQWSRSSPGACGIVATRCTEATEGGVWALRVRLQDAWVLDMSYAVASVLRSAVLDTSVVPISLASDLGMAPGQPNYRSFNQRWKVRMLAGWDHHTSPDQRIRCSSRPCGSSDEAAWRMENALLRYGPDMDNSASSSSLSRSFERAPAGQDLSGGTVASYLVGVCQFTAFLQPHGRELAEATRTDLEGSSPASSAAGRRRPPPPATAAVWPYRQETCSSPPLSVTRRRGRAESGSSRRTAPSSR